MAQQFGEGTVKRRSRARSVLLRARELGIAGEVEAMQLALAATIGVYDQILATAPSQFKPLVLGAGEKAIGVAREILGAV